MYWFSADEHHLHGNIIKYCNRPFSSAEEMSEELIRRHNEVVGKDDVTIHAGDFAFVKTYQQAMKIADRLNGKHIFLKGSHDKWVTPAIHEVWEKRIDNQLIVVCHYCMRTWAASHYNSWHLYGHSHSTLAPIGKSWDVGVDNNNFYPLSFAQICDIMKDREDNPNLIKR